MTTRPLSEKAAELLFSRYLLQAIGLRKAQLFAPSSWEERLTGYDQSIIGLSRYREVNLQFKSPKVVSKWSRFSLGLDRDQHRTLIRLYAPGTAFYVAHTFLDLASANRAQLSPDLTAARDFLTNFICIDVGALPSEARSIHYHRSAGSAKPTEVTFKADGDGASREDGTPIAKGLWFRADALLDGLSDGSVGKAVDVSGETQGVDKRKTPSRKGDTIASSDIGVFVQLPVP